MQHSRRLPCLAALATFTLLGCRGTHDEIGATHADIPHGAIPAPLGSYACQWQNAQNGLAEQDNFVIYPNEWRYGADEIGTRLGPAGERRLEEFVRRLPLEPYIVVIDKSEDTELDQARRAAVVGYLISHGVHDADSRVVVGRGQAGGLYGLEAPQIGGGFLQSGSSGAGRSGGTNTRGGGLGGRGFGGGGMGGGFGGGLGGGGFF